MKTMLLACVLLAGCAAQLPVRTISAPFDEAYARRQVEPGVNTVKGNAFMRQRGGGVVTCAGSAVLLIPASAYASERMRAIYGSPDLERAQVSTQRYRFEPDIPAYLTIVKQATCDSQGNFTFDRIADGTFYVVTAVGWQVGYNAQGGFMAIRVAVKDGQTVSVVMAG